MRIINRPINDTKWHRLDNTATVFPVISNKTFSGVYRMSVRLKSDIDPEILQKALDVTIPWFDSFLVRLRRGFFWYYFESNHKRPLVQEEKNGPCGYIDPVPNSHLLFRVIYFKNRISLEVFHALSDGTGTINFLKELTLCYLRLSELSPNTPAKISLPTVEVTCDSEDSYIKNYQKTAKLKMTSERSYQLRGDRLPLYSTGIIHGYLPVDELLKVCRDKGVTITQYLCSLLLYSIYVGNMNRQPSKYPVKIFVPVNLRPLFDSTTTMNFFSNIAIGFRFKNQEHTMDDILTSVVSQYKEQMNKDLFLQKIAANVRLGKNIFARFIPLVIKNLIVKIAYLMSFDSYSTTLTNLGNVSVPEKFSDMIDSFGVQVNVADREPFKCGICSYANKMNVIFTSRYKDAYLQRTFFRELVKEGVNVSIETNGVYYEDL